MLLKVGRVINIRTYITLGLISISASGMQGMNCMRSIQSYVPQLTQKLYPYHYHIGGALVIAGLLYSGYRYWKKAQHTALTSMPKQTDIAMSSDKHISPYKIEYKAAICPTQSTGPYYSVEIQSILLNNQKILQECVPTIPWRERDGQVAIDNFIEQVRADFQNESENRSDCNSHATPVFIMYSGWRLDTTIEKMLKVKPTLAYVFTIA